MYWVQVASYSMHRLIDIFLIIISNVSVLAQISAIFPETKSWMEKSITQRYTNKFIRACPPLWASLSLNYFQRGLKTLSCLLTQVYVTVHSMFTILCSRQKSKFGNKYKRKYVVKQPMKALVEKTHNPKSKWTIVSPAPSIRKTLIASCWVPDMSIQTTILKLQTYNWSSLIE